MKLAQILICILTFVQSEFTNNSMCKIHSDCNEKKEKCASVTDKVTQVVDDYYCLGTTDYCGDSDEKVKEIEIDNKKYLIDCDPPEWQPKEEGSPMKVILFICLAFVAIFILGCVWRAKCANKK